MIFNMTAGGNPLNFKVVGGTTEPSNPKENTIWINTEQIGAWYFSATQPEGMQEWDVWFPTGTSSPIEFNALKKKGIQVYPNSAKQYVSGACMDKTAKTWQGGKWVDWWEGYLYHEGNKYEDYSGGWVKDTVLSNIEPSVSFKSDHINLAASGSSGNSAYYRSGKKIDLTSVKTLRIVANCDSGSYGSNRAMVKLRQDTSSIAAEISIPNKDKHEYSLDVSSLSGEYYVCFGVWFAENASRSIDIYTLQEIS